MGLALFLYIGFGVGYIMNSGLWPTATMEIMIRQPAGHRGLKAARR
jgi:hypothetical protein